MFVLFHFCSVIYLFAVLLRKPLRNVTILCVVYFLLQKVNVLSPLRSNGPNKSYCTENKLAAAGEKLARNWTNRTRKETVLAFKVKITLKSRATFSLGWIQISLIETRQLACSATSEVSGWTKISFLKAVIYLVGNN